MKNTRSRAFLAFLLCICAGQAAAQDSAQPYWASLDEDEVYMRVGPSVSYPIEWVYKRDGLPVKVLRVNEGWRYVEDPEGTRGWMSSTMLTRARGAIVTGDDAAEMRAQADPVADVLWYAEPGVVGQLGECGSGWCELDVAGHVGWVRENQLWGDGEP